MCSQKKPKFLFLCETLCKKDLVERLRVKLGFEGSFSVDASGRKGGLALFWKIYEEANLLSFSPNHIDVEVRIRGMSTWRLTGFYGEPNRRQRDQTWTLLRSLHSESSLPWCIIDDFNNISTHSDKRGGHLYPTSLIDGFQSVIDDCNLIDLDLRGYPFTWDRGRGTGHCVEIRLDKAIFSLSWLDTFTEATLTNIGFSNSDHTPIILQPDSHHSTITAPHFRYENVWDNLTKWGSDLTGNFKGRISTNKKKMAQLKQHHNFPLKVECSVTNAQNEELLKPIAEEEIKTALFQMHPDKAPGPDVRAYLVKLVTNFFDTGCFPRELNETNLVLIPKKKNFTSMGDLRPIALCNVAYKVLSKVIANLMHYLKRKTKGKKDFMALKLDMSKAYDRVEWDYLRFVMACMSFAERWINLIMACVFSSIILLFMEAILWVLSFLREVAHGAPPITHMFFTDNSYLFCQSTTSVAGNVSNLLNQFETTSGQKVNFSKSTVFFSPNTCLATSVQIFDILHMPEASDRSLYLGLPNIIRRNKNVVLGFLKTKVIARINSWDGRLLSRAGKEILFKTVVQSLPTYAMSVFLLPLGTCNEIEKLMAWFWWKSSSSKGKCIIWRSWDRMAAHKYDGGMGFRHLHDFNIPMLAKQGWRLLCNLDTLVGKVYKARYFPHSDFLSVELGSNPSFVWRGIWTTQYLLHSGVRRIIESGDTVSILNHPWLPVQDNPYVSTIHPGLMNQHVRSLFHVHSRS
ncbi:uncharacterized protein LOC133036775 [Cannabis sativa]|uniref:uncharacterized protein LOC133036775 n=1 Tax=Cannabis sativa TaxID=3483 RepID=UPI0029CA52B1|nr:uncharacterized protein LOC133036775 [Cannabis sativa]